MALLWLSACGGPDASSLPPDEPYAPVETLDIRRSLVWTDGRLLDDPSFAGLARVMAAAAGGPGGQLFERWFSRFATTAHSERVGPTLLLEEIASAQGDDPGAWDLDALPFTVTAVHNRIDRRNDAHCGELRISMASTHPLYRPLHLIFLFRQPATPGDVSPTGEVHCLGTARRWAALSELDDDGFDDAAGAWLDETITPARFELAESVELTISPWEFRQWQPVENSDPATRAQVPVVFDNPPLFQTVDIETLNQPGARRDDFIRWVQDNAADLDARRAEIPAAFRARSARLNEGVPWQPLDLTGIDPAVSSSRPNLRGNIEIMGCPACHSADAEFVQTDEHRDFSRFYTRELDARLDYLHALQRELDPRAPFGPLQSSPILPSP